MQRLTRNEIEERIDSYRTRIDSLADVVREIRDENAKKVLQEHITSYEENIEKLRLELERRNKIG